MESGFKTWSMIGHLIENHLESKLKMMDVCGFFVVADVSERRVFACARKFDKVVNYRTIESAFSNIFEYEDEWGNFHFANTKIGLQFSLTLNYLHIGTLPEMIKRDFDGVSSSIQSVRRSSNIYWPGSDPFVVRSLWFEAANAYLRRYQIGG